jgi:hypothetical protein
MAENTGAQSTAASPPIETEQAPREPQIGYQLHVPSDQVTEVPPGVLEKHREGSVGAALQVAQVGAQRVMNDEISRISEPTPFLPGDEPISTPDTGSNTIGKEQDKNSLPGLGDFPMANATPPSVQTPPIRGRPIGRPRGSRARGPTRASTRGGRGGKRKRNDEDDDNSSDSEIITTSAQTTKSGRNVQKPTSFVPPPQPSPQATPVYKRKKPTYRKNPESAVCKVCLRGVSPASNMIVFCDGCNTPYHQWCHQPPIDKSVIEEIDKEWFCRPCERERIQPVPEVEVLGFVAAEGASAEEVSMFRSQE